MSSFADETEEKAVDGLCSYLPELSARGSADDMSVGCILDIDYIRENRNLFEPVKKEKPEEAENGDGGDNKLLTDEEVLALEEMMIKDNEKITGICIEYGTMGLGGSNTSGPSCDSHDEYTLDQLRNDGSLLKFGNHKLCAVINDVIYLKDNDNKVTALIDKGALFVGDGVAYDTYEYNRIAPVFKNDTLSE